MTASMTNTDEALVAEGLSNADWFDERERMGDGRLSLVRTKETGSLLRRLASRLSALLSQPTSGGWDDAAVERACRAYKGDMIWNAITLAGRRELMSAMRAALNAAAPRESLSVEKEDE